MITADNVALREAIRIYGSHLESCELSKEFGENCTCGFHKLLSTPHPGDALLCAVEAAGKALEVATTPLAEDRQTVLAALAALAPFRKQG